MGFNDWFPPLPSPDLFGGKTFNILVSDMVRHGRVFASKPGEIIVAPRTLLGLRLELDPYLDYAQRCVGYELIRMYLKRYNALPTEDFLMRRVRKIKTRPSTYYGPAVCTRLDTR